MLATSLKVLNQRQQLIALPKNLQERQNLPPKVSQSITVGIKQPEPSMDIEPEDKKDEVAEPAPVAEDNNGVIEP